MASPDEQLSALRQAIDAVDDELVGLLNRRADLAREVAEVKRARDQPFWAPHRERQVLERLQRAQTASGGVFPVDALRPVFSEIISACLSLEQKLRVAFLGPEATLTHQAARARFGLAAHYVPSPTMAAVVDEVSRGGADIGVVPVESASDGVVAHAYELLGDSDLLIVQEVAAPGGQCLLARGPVDGVRKVYGHPHALAACRGWLQRTLPQATPLEVSGAALAARLARDDASAAALGPEVAGALYDLHVLARDAFDGRAQSARHVVVGRAAHASGPTGIDRTSLLLAVRDAPGALQRALAPFAEGEINLSRVESRPPSGGGRWWESGYAFVDCDGHAEEPPLQRALARLRDDGALVRVLGSYPRAPRPSEETSP